MTLGTFLGLTAREWGIGVLCFYVGIVYGIMALSMFLHDRRTTADVEDAGV